MQIVVRLVFALALGSVLAIMSSKLYKNFMVPEPVPATFYANSNSYKSLKEAQPSPEPSDDSILIAMEMFGIQMVEGHPMPVYDPNLEDRGLSVISEKGKRCDVRIGPSAFQSWAILGSTLGHEIEVHCHQDMMLIKVMDMAGSLGTHMAERAAYRYEISQKKRFGLSEDEVDSIQKTMDYYFPEKW